MIKSESISNIELNCKSECSIDDEIQNEIKLIKELLIKEDKCQVDSNTNIFYQLYGSGDQKLLFIMGLNGTHHLWLRQALYFAQLGTYQVCVFDNRGIGLSDKPLGKYSITRFSKDTLKLLDHLGWHEGIHLVGMSMGGMIAQQLCLMQPTKFSTMTLTSTYHSAIKSVPTLQDAQFFMQMITRSPNNWHEPLIRIAFPKRWRAQEHKPGILRSDYLLSLFLYFNNGMPNQNLITMYLQALAAINHNLLPYQLKKIQQHGIRCIVLHGHKDRVIRMKNGIELSQLLKCPFVQIQNGGHAIMIQEPEAYNGLLRAHLEEAPLDTYLNGAPFAKLGEDHWMLMDAQSNLIQKKKSKFLLRSPTLILPQLLQSYRTASEGMSKI